jgi:hypothetical protein
VERLNCFYVPLGMYCDGFSGMRRHQEAPEAILGCFVAFRVPPGRKWTEGEDERSCDIFLSLFRLLSLPRACQRRFPRPVTYATYRRGKTRLSLKGQKRKGKFYTVQLSAVTDLMPTTLAESNSLLLLPSPGSALRICFARRAVSRRSFTVHTSDA